jgi:hypothetical protein
MKSLGKLLAGLLLLTYSLKAQNASIRVIHASPGTPAVDIRLSSYSLAQPAASNLAFPNATGYVTPAAGLYNAFVTVAGTQTVALSGAANLPAGVPLSVYAIGSLALGKDLNANLQLKAVIDTFQSRPANTATLVRVAHFCPDAPAVDILARLGGSIVTLVSNVSFTGVTPNSIPVPASVNLAQDSLLITPTGQANAVVYRISFGDLLAGQNLNNNFTVAAIGLINGTGNQSFRLRAYPVVNPGGGTAILQVVHASPNTPAVDAYLNAITLGAPQIQNLVFPSAANFLSVPSGNYLAYASVTGQTAPAITATATLSPNLPYSVFALDTLRLGNALNNNLRLVAVVDTFALAPANTAAQLRVAHFCPDAPAVRILLKLGNSRLELLSSVSFLDFTTGSIAVPNTVNPTADSVIVALPNGGSDVYRISIGDLLGAQLAQGATRFTVAAIGRLSLLGANDPLAFRLQAYQTQNQFSNVTRIENKAAESFRLAQNYPNPFNPTTTIAYQLSNAVNVSLKVFDVIGREVATLVNERQSAGSYQAAFNATNLSSGVYFYRLQAGNFTETRKMMLVK